MGPGRGVGEPVAQGAGPIVGAATGPIITQVMGQAVEPMSAPRGVVGAAGR